MEIQQLEKELSQILSEIIDSEEKINSLIHKVHRDYRLSAKNLMRYIILRSRDLRIYHDILSDLGLSSLRSAEGYVYSNLYSVVRNLNLIRNTPFKIHSNVEVIGYSGSKELIRKHANNLFNAKEKERFTEIMVTLPDEAAENKDMIKNMVLNGMGIARLNLSHGDSGAWEKTVENIKSIERETGQKIKIYMDLSGPKLRTSKIKFHTAKGKIKGKIPIQVGEHILLAKKEIAGKKSAFLENEGLKDKVIGVLLDEIIDDAKIGDLLLFDDGMIKSKVIDKKENELLLEITDCYKQKLGSLKGINLPDTKLNLPALTTKDIADLPFICRYADIIGYSFVRRADDVTKLYRELQKLNAVNTGVVFKIENREAFENLPEILIKGMERDKIGVMIARGDLAVEIGFERISEVQNQILWLCEAAHIPVIWATQVLDNLAKTGIPTRAEISDAALAVQAECVMLNKGPKINQAIKALKNILIRMEGHSFKKKNELRALGVANLFIEKYMKNPSGNN
jgi:pyruvate kinase